MAWILARVVGHANALDLLMSEAGYHRGSGNPLLWQTPEQRSTESVSST